MLDLDLAGPLTLIVDRVERRSLTSVSVACRLDSGPDGFALICLEGDAVAALIQAPSTGKLFRIGYLAGRVRR